MRSAAWERQTHGSVVYWERDPKAHTRFVGGIVSCFCQMLQCQDALIPCRLSAGLVCQDICVVTVYRTLCALKPRFHQENVPQATA